MSNWIQRRWRDEPRISERLPVDVFPCSNGEFDPGPVTEQQRQIMAVAEEATEEARRKFGMTRREFVRTAAAYTIGLWAIDQVVGTERLHAGGALIGVVRGVARGLFTDPWGPGCYIARIRSHEARPVCGHRAGRTATYTGSA